MGSFVFSTFAGLRGAVSLILAQQLVLDQGQYPHEARVIAEVSTQKHPLLTGGVIATSGAAASGHLLRTVKTR